jgi:thiamine-monophosphate kinase
MNLREMGEGSLIRTIRDRFYDPSIPLGIGDDAAIVDIPAGHSVVACSDLIVEGTHFIRDVHPPDSIGYKCVAVNVSDVGAMAGTPMHFLISFAAPGDLDWAWIEGFLDGVKAACEKFSVSLIGGDSSSSDRIFVDVSMLGRVRSGGAVRRSGARAGDGIYVTGTLGASAFGLECLKRGNRDDASVHRHLYPDPRPRVGAALIDIAHAMIDVSDGLSTDLGHIVEESRVSARIYIDLLPAAPGANLDHVLHGGEEYELVVIAPSAPKEIEGVPLTRIGEIIPSSLDYQTFLIDGPTQSVLKPRGWQHF